MAYDFSALNDKEFEELVRDLLSIELGKRLQSFKRGKDNGIDARYSTNSKKNEIVVQVKHYVESGFSAIYKAFEKEKTNIFSLDPTRYIIATSTSFLPGQKGKLFKLFTPYILSTNDIYGNEDLNQILSDNKKVEEKYFKLWLSSTTVLKRILSNAIKGRSEFVADKIKRNIRKYVYTASLKKANTILKKHKMLMITGQPGVGKSTLANLLIYRFLSKNYELIVIDRDIKEAEQELSNDPKVKQVFYFDDFLGANYFEILNPKTSDSAIVNFIERIRNTENKYLILTTRTTILNTARVSFEKIKNADLDSARHELELSEYTSFEKAKILYSHIFFGKLGKERLVQLYEDKNYYKIIKHKNFNPRLIEFITDKVIFEKEQSKKYLDFALSILDYPEKIWSHSFENQINEEDRLLLLTLFSMGSKCEEVDLKKAFEHRVSFEVKVNGFKKSVDQYNKCLKRLLDGHIKRLHYGEDNFQVSFINPSLADYLIFYLKNSSEERSKMYKATCFVNQTEILIESVLVSAYKKLVNEREALDFFSWFKTLNINLELPMSEHQEYEKCKKMQMAISLISVPILEDLVDDFIAEELQSLELIGLSNYRLFDFLMPVLEKCSVEGKISTVVRERWEVIINALLNVAIDESEIDQIKSLFDYFERSYDEYMLETTNRAAVRSAIEKLWDDFLSGEISNKRNKIESEEEFEEFRGELLEKWKEYHDMMDLDAREPSLAWELNQFDDDLFERNREYNAVPLRENTLFNNIGKSPSTKRLINDNQIIEDLFDGSLIE